MCLPISRVPIVALTANAFNEDAAKCRAAGMNTHIPKPFKSEDLVVALAKALRERAGLTESAGPAPAPLPQPPVSAAPPTPIDRTALDAMRSDLGDTAVTQIIAKFLETTPGQVARFAEIARADGGHVEARRIVHSLKSSSALVGARALSELSAALEARIAANAPVTPEEIAELNDRFAAVRRALSDTQALAA